MALAMASHCVINAGGSVAAAAMRPGGLGLKSGKGVKLVKLVQLL